MDSIRRKWKKMETFLPLWMAVVILALSVAALVYYPPFWNTDAMPVPVTAFFVPGEDKVAINEAPVEELTVLPGIGETRAQAIVEYRQQNGDFQSLADLAKVQGIGPKTLEKLEDMIAF